MGQRDWAGRQAEEIGARVAARRKAAGLSQTELASRCVAMGLPSMTRRIVVALEAGERESIPLSELTVIAAVLGVSPVDLIVPFTAETAEVLPDLKLAPWEAARWWSGEAALVDGVFTLERRLGPARLYQDHAQMMQVLADEEIDEENEPNFNRVEGGAPVPVGQTAGGVGRPPANNNNRRRRRRRGGRPGGSAGGQS